jgi:hypothetical protein
MTLAHDATGHPIICDTAQSVPYRERRWQKRLSSKSSNSDAPERNCSQSVGARTTPFTMSGPAPRSRAWVRPGTKADSKSFTGPQERAVGLDRFGRIILSIDDSLQFIAHEDISWVMT